MSLLLFAGEIMPHSDVVEAPRLTAAFGYALMYAVTAAIEILCVATVYVALARDAD